MTRLLNAGVVAQQKIQDEIDAKHDAWKLDCMNDEERFRGVGRNGGVLLKKMQRGVISKCIINLLLYIRKCIFLKGEMFVPNVIAIDPAARREMNKFEGSRKWRRGRKLKKQSSATAASTRDASAEFKSPEAKEKGWQSVLASGDMLRRATKQSPAASPSRTQQKGTPRKKRGLSDREKQKLFDGLFDDSEKM